MQPQPNSSPAGTQALRFLFLLSCLLFACPAAAGVNKDVLKAVEQEFNLEWREMRSPQDRGPVVWFEQNGATYSYSLPDRFSVLGSRGASFRIREIEYEDTHVALQMKSDTGSRVELLVFDTTEGTREKIELSQTLVDDVVPSVLARVFEFRSHTSSPSLTVNRSSGLIHLSGCNHLPDSSHRGPFQSLAKALEAGHRVCPVCFSDETTLQLPDYGLIRRQAIEESRLYEIAFPLVEDEAVQEEVQRVGERIVESLPFDRLGFEYRFRVVRSSIPNAVSFPTGLVYVTSSLFEAIEDPGELEFILAHEVSHCELHYNEPGLDDEVPINRIEVQIWYANARNREIESDLGALACLLADRPSANPIGPANSILRKLQYFLQETVIERSSRFATHLSASERLRLLALDRFTACYDPPVFRGKNGEGETVVTIRPLGLAVWPKHSGSTRVGISWNPTAARHQLFFLVEAGESLDEVGWVNSGRVGSRDGPGSDVVRITVYSELGPGRAAILSGWCFDDPGRLEDLSTLEFGITGVQEWELVATR